MISNEIIRLQTAKSDLKTAIEAKGVTVPSSSTIDDYANYISQISGSGLAYEEGTIVLNEPDTQIVIPYSGTSQNVLVLCVIQTPTYAVNGSIAYVGTNIFFNHINISSSSFHYLVGTFETRSDFSNYAGTCFGYNQGLSVDNSQITLSSRSNAYPFQAGTYNYLIIEL